MLLSIIKCKKITLRKRPYAMYLLYYYQLRREAKPIYKRFTTYQNIFGNNFTYYSLIL